MKIFMMTPKAEFNQELQARLTRLGQVAYTTSRREYSMAELVRLAKGAEIIGFDPDNIGGFEAAPKRLVELLEKTPKVRGLALSTTAFGYVDRDYCKKRGIAVANVPFYSSESVAEQTIAFMLGACKRIFVTDRRTQKDKYRLEEGFEIRGKTLGVIGLGHIGTRVAELGMALGMKVVAYNRSRKKVAGVKLAGLDEVLENADFISLHLADKKETAGIISREKIAKLKKGAIVINTADRWLVDEAAMAKALKTGKVDTYVVEAEDLKSPPLGGIENCVMFRGFGWYTREALERNKEIWVGNIEGMAKGKPQNRVC